MAADGTVCVVIGDSTRPRAGFSTLRCAGGLVADLEAYERAANPDGRELASNPYDVAWDGGDGWYVSDAAANAVLHVDRGGRIRTVAVVASMAPFGGRPAQGVPTGLARAADGTVYVALFGGAPADGGPAVVVALRPSPAGGRTRPTAVASAVAPIGVTPGPEGLAVLDYGGGPADRGRGRILLVARPADPGRVAATGLGRPVGMVRLPDGRYVVAETDSSRLRLVTLGDPPAAVSSLTAPSSSSSSAPVTWPTSISSRPTTRRRHGGSSIGVQVEAGRDGEAAADRSRDRAAVGVQTEHPLNGGPLCLVGGQPVGHVDAPDHQDLAVQLDLADRVRVETTVSGGDAARLQRAPEGPGQSPGSRGHQVVQGGRMRLAVLGVSAVVLGHRAVDPEGHRRSSAGTVAVRSGPRCRVTVTWERKTTSPIRTSSCQRLPLTPHVGAGGPRWLFPTDVVISAVAWPPPR